MASQLVRLTQQRHEHEIAFQNGMVELLRNWRTLHPTDVIKEIDKLHKVMEQIDALEGALAMIDNRG